MCLRMVCGVWPLCVCICYLPRAISPHQLFGGSQQLSGGRKEPIAIGPLRTIPGSYRWVRKSSNSYRHRNIAPDSSLYAGSYRGVNNNPHELSGNLNSNRACAVRATPRTTQRPSDALMHRTDADAGALTSRDFVEVGRGHCAPQSAQGGRRA
jgi:hypothetical protein